MTTTAPTAALPSLRSKLQVAVGDWRVWVLFLVLQVPSLRALTKYLPWPAVPVVLAATWFLYADLLHDGAVSRWAQRRLSRAWILMAMLAALFVIQTVVYPRADLLKFQGRGTPQDDALVVGGEYLLNGLNPYEALTYRNEYVSAGPGWILLALPFVMTGAIGFFNPVWLLITVVVLWRMLRSFRVPLLFLILLMSSLAFWELTVTGSDMISIGCALLLSCLAAYRFWSPPDGTLTRGKAIAGKAVSVILLAFTSTSRIVFAYTIPLIGGFVWRRDAKRGLVITVVTAGLTLILHLIFFLWNPPAYFPLYRFSDTDFLPGIIWPVTAAVASLLMMVLAIQTVRDNLQSWIFNLWFAVTVAMFFSALGDLIMRNFSLPAWEGANYLAVVIPIFAAWIALQDEGGKMKDEAEVLSS